MVNLSAPLLVPLDVRCPHCSAPPGQQCTSLDASVPWYLRRCHTQRVWKARQDSARMAQRRAQGRRR